MRRRTLVLASLSGALLGVASLPGPFGPIAFVGLCPLLFRLTDGIGPLHGLKAGFVAGVVYFAIGFGFVPLSIAEAGAAPLAAYLVGVPMLAASIGLFGALVVLAGRVSMGLGLWAAPALWIGLELARSEEWVLSVPWMHLAYSLGDQPELIQAASAIGLYGISFWIVCVNAAIVTGLRSQRLIGAGVGTLALLAIPPLVFSEPAAEPSVPTLRIAAIQPDLSDQVPGKPRALDAALPSLLALSEHATAGGADLVVWPESAYPRPLGDAPDPLLGVLANAFGVPLLTGAWKTRPDPGLLRNAAFLAREGGAVVAAAEKVHPVPVYERAPDGALSRSLASLGLWSGIFEPGDAMPPVRVARADGSTVSLGVLVCIDASYPEIARRLRSDGALALIQISNEAATGRWAAELHARVVRFRAIENRSPFVRVANTGPTLWIDARGRVLDRIDASSSGSSAAAISLAGPAPLATRLTDSSRVSMALGVTIVGVGGQSIFRRRRGRSAGRREPRTFNEEMTQCSTELARS
ncbi:MAG: apolipoprotein N-acyltransferase [Myxococcota bacterium]